MTTSGNWPNNTTGEIGADDLRQGIQDLFDSQVANWPIDQSGIIASDSVSGLVGVDFASGLPAPAWREGRVFYDQLNHCLAAYNDASGVILQVGQETYVRIINQTAADISNGTIVEIVSAGNSYPSVRPAIAGANTSPHVIGYATHDIPSTEQGFVTINGLINNINTSAFTVGDKLYLSPTTSGAFTNVAPEAPVPKIHVGSVIVDHAIAGRILAHIETNPKLEDASNVNGTTAQDNYLLRYNAASGYWDPSPEFITARITSSDSPYSAPASGDILFASTTDGDIYVDMHSGVEGNYYKLANCGISGNLLTVSGFSGQTVYGAASQTLNDGDVLEMHYNRIEGWW